MVWTSDTREQFIEMVQYFTPDPFNTISFHFDICADVGSTGDYLMQYVEADKKSNKAIFFGEFGDLRVYESLESNSMEEFRSVYDQLLGFIRADDIQIACG